MIEVKMRGLNAIGEQITSRHPDRQAAVIYLRVAWMNYFNARGTDEIVRIVGCRRRKG